MRLDNYLYKHGFTDSRNRAKELILNKKVSVNSSIITKASFNVDNNLPLNIEILQESIYVGRGAEKLKYFLLSNKIDIKNRRCLDVGSSTGGFVQILLENGAAFVTAVDVGTGQLHRLLKQDRRVCSVEQTDIRDFVTDELFDVVTCDVSFVGIEYIMKDLDRLSRKDIIILFKPQFEVGKDVKRNKKGVIKDQKAIESAIKKFQSQTYEYGWKLIAKEYCKIKGKEGNAEIFYHFQK